MNNMEAIIKNVRLVDDVLNYNSNIVGTYSPIVQKIKEKTAAYTVLSSDVGVYLRINSAASVNVTIEDFTCEIGGCISFEQAGAGVITLVASGVTLNSLDGGLKSMGQYAVMQIIKTGESTFTVIGSTT